VCVGETVTNAPYLSAGVAYYVTKRYINSVTFRVL